MGPDMHPRPAAPRPVVGRGDFACRRVAQLLPWLKSVSIPVASVVYPPLHRDFTERDRAAMTG